MRKKKKKFLLKENKSCLIFLGKVSLRSTAVTLKFNNIEKNTVDHN